MKSEAQSRRFNTQLTKIMAQAEHDLSAIENNLNSIWRSLNGSASDVLTGIAGHLPSDKLVYVQQDLKATIDKALRDINEARSLSTRFLRVTENALGMAEAFDPVAMLKQKIFESDWYKKKFPLDWEKQRQIRELKKERRYIPEKDIWKTPEEDEDEAFREELRRRHRRTSIVKSIILTKRAQEVGQLRAIIEDLQTAIKQINNFINTYLSNESPLLAAATKVQNRLLKYVKKLQEYGLGSHVNIVSEAFGNSKQPGKYVTVGRDAFLKPIVKLLEDAIETLSGLLGTKMQEIMNELPGEEKSEEEVSTPMELELPGEEPSVPTATPGEALSRLETLMRKIGALDRQKQRHDVLQRLTI